jgi:PhnB protein
MGKAKAKDRKRDEEKDAAQAEKKPAKKGYDAEGRRKAKKAKPRGMRWVNPFLTVRDVTAALAWYERAFGFKTSFTLPGPDGKPVHAEMTHRKSVIMMGPEALAYSKAPGKDGSPVSLYCYCDDVDALCAAARASGAKVAEEPADQFWGDRTCFLVDPEGHQWTFATHVFDLDPDAPMPDAQCAEEAMKGSDGNGAGGGNGGNGADGKSHASSSVPGVETAMGKVPAKT